MTPSTSAATTRPRVGDGARLEGALSTEDGKHYKLLLADGRWAAEIAGGPFVGEQAFLEAVDSLVVTPAG